MAASDTYRCVVEFDLTPSAWPLPYEPFGAEAVRELRAFAHAHMRRESPPTLQLVLQLVRRAVRHVLKTLSDVRPYASQVEGRSGRSPNSVGHEGVPRFSHFVQSHLVDSNPGPMRYELAADLPDGRFVRHLAGFHADCAWLRHGDEDEFGDESAHALEHRCALPPSMSALLTHPFIEACRAHRYPCHIYPRHMEDLSPLRALEHLAC